MSRNRNDKPQSIKCSFMVVRLTHVSQILPCMDEEMGRVDGHNNAAVLFEGEGCTNGIFNVNVLRRSYDSHACVNTEVPLSAWQGHKQ